MRGVQVFLGARWVRGVVATVLGAVLALAVGLGLAAALPGPPEPQAPAALVLAQEQRALLPSEQRRWDAHEGERRRWLEDTAAHHRTATAVLLGSAVALLAAGVDLERRRRLLADGVLLAGVLTLLHSVVRALMSRDTLLTFTVVDVTLVFVLALGWRRFVLRVGDDAGQEDVPEERPRPAGQDPDGDDPGASVRPDP